MFPVKEVVINLKFYEIENLSSILQNENIQSYLN